jgi:sporulation protein YlmC with PRC-barrel domain
MSLTRRPKIEYGHKESEMIRTFLTATAVSVLMLGSAVAQSQDQASQDEGLDMQSAQTNPASPSADPSVTVRSGDTIYIEPTSDGQFTLNFQIGQTGAGMGGGQISQTAPGQTLVERNQLQQGDPEQLSVDNLMGSDVYGANDENVGNVNDVLLTEDGDVDAMVVDVGGFLGIGSRQVALGVDNLEFMIDAGSNWYVFTPFTSDELESQPEYDPSTYQDNYENQRLTAQ